MSPSEQSADFNLDKQAITSKSPAGEVVQVSPGDGSAKDDVVPPRGKPFPIVGIGASAGGLDAFTQLLKALPNSTGMAFVLVQHLDPSHDSQLPEILSAATSMPVHTVEDGIATCPNEVFVIPPNATMVVEGGVLRLASRQPGLHLPIDAFFRSLARAQGGRAIAVVLSGNASDGSQGVRAIKEQCGLTFAQDESTAAHPGMPRNAIATGAIDYVLSPQDIARELVHLGQHPFVRPPQPELVEAEILPEDNGDLRKILAVLRAMTKVDFGNYKKNTVRRRIGRRMIVKRSRDLNEYARLVEKNPEEVRELYNDLLISVTSFFRDPAVFDALGHLIGDQLETRNAEKPFRVWVPGCATGEELYSLAICVKELIDDRHLNTPLQFFGTDISDIALDRARAAIYPDLIEQDVSPERLRRFFARVDRGYQVTKSIRENCVFARQDVTNDPPFGRTDVISCRNLLIYLDSDLQRKVLPVFHYSLNAIGLLLLGTAESIAAASDLFTTVHKQHRIYGRKAVPVRLAAPRRTSGAHENNEPVKVRSTLRGIDLEKKVDRVIQSKYAPAAVVVDGDWQILHFKGSTSFYLEPPTGEATHNLLRMARESLSIPLRKAIQAASSRGISVKEEGVSVEHRGERREINVEVTPISGSSPDERYFLVVFEEAAPDAAPIVSAAYAGDVKPLERIAALEAQVRELQQQLAESRELLRNTNEDHEASSEELRAANEEIRSANEELQSTNEELGTTKEELQSANEELTTLNEELQNRNHDLDELNNDLLNLLSAIEIPFVMVDNSLRLRRFSAAAQKVLNVNSIDIGHTIGHLADRIDLSTFQAAMRKVIETLTVEHWELQDKEGHWFTATIRPYCTIDSRISGAVVVLVDIDPLKRTLRAAEEARDYAEGMIETVREPLLVLDADLRIQRATTAFYEKFRVSRVETEGRPLYDLGNGQWNVPLLRELIGEALFRNLPFQDFEVQHDFPHIGRRTMRLNAQRISRDQDESRVVLLAIEDVTERRKEAEVLYRRLFETAKDAMLIFDAETEKLTDVNPFFSDLAGYGRERLIGLRLGEMAAFRGAKQIAKIVSQARTEDIVRHQDVPLQTIDGKQVETEIVANSYTVGGQLVVQVNIRDVTKRNRAVHALRDSEERFRLLVDSVRDYALFQTDPTGMITSWNVGAERLLGYKEAEILGRSAFLVFTPEDVERGEATHEIETARASGTAEDERWHIRKDGSRFFASGVLTTVHDEAGHLRGFAKIMRDVTERRREEQQLKQQAQLLQLAQDIIMVRRLSGSITFWNNSAVVAYGWSEEEAVGNISHDLLKTTFPKPLVELEATLLKDGRWEGELTHTRRDGSQIFVWSRWALQFDSKSKPVFVLEINSDITDRKVADRKLRSSLQEKDILLKEIHHRVKNNLQVISSLLNLQSEYVGDAKTLAMLADMESRVRSIATIHEMLYGSSDLSRIDFAAYLASMAKDLASLFSETSNRVRMNVNSEPIVLAITQAVPCGLIINELLTNSFKYAFPENRSGAIDVSFRCTDGQCTLDIADNGIGLPDESKLRSTPSMGLQLLGLLVRQLKGEMTIDRSSGTRFTVVFERKPM